MLRKFLYVLLAASVLYALAAVKKGKPRRNGAARQSIKKTISLVAWTLLAVYLAYFFYWVYTQLR